MERDFAGRAILIVVCAEFLKSSADVPLPVIGLFGVPIAMKQSFPILFFFLLLHVHENKSINSTVRSICGFKIGQSFFYVSIYCRWVSPFASMRHNFRYHHTRNNELNDSLSLCIDVYRAIKRTHFLVFSLMQRDPISAYRSSSNFLLTCVIGCNCAQLRCSFNKSKTDKLNSNINLYGKSIFNLNHFFQI